MQIRKVSYDEMCSSALYDEAISNLENNHITYEIELADSHVTMSAAHLSFNTLFWKIKADMGQPVEARHVFKDNITSGKTIAKLLSVYYDDVFEIDATEELLDRLIDSIWEFYNKLYEYCLLNCSEYIVSISAIDLASTYLHPDIVKYCRPEFDDLASAEQNNVMLEEKKAHFVRLLKENPEINRPLSDITVPGFVRVNQATSMFVAHGYTTDINDVAVKQPIKSNLIGGMQNVVDMILDSLNGKKPIYYGKIAISRSQYFARKEQLATCVIKNIYRKGCGSSLLVPFEVTEKNYKHLSGKYFVESGELKVMTQKTSPRYVDKTIDMYSPLTCRHTDGVCIRCGGKVLYNIPKTMNIGMHSSSSTTSQATQYIMSAKHISTFSTKEFKMTDDALEFFTRRVKGIYFKRDKPELIRQAKLGIILGEISGAIDDILLDGSKIQEERFSRISSIMIKFKDQDIVLDLEDGGTYPYITKEMLGYMRDNFSDIVIDDKVLWIDLKNFTKVIPVFDIPLYNDSMLAYVSTVANFLQKDIQSYTSAAIALRDFTNIIYEKVSINLTFLEVHLKAYLINGVTDYRVPIVNDLHDVKFAKNSHILFNRTVSGELAYQEYWRYLTDMNTYVYPKSSSPFDVLFSFLDDDDEVNLK